MAVACIAAQEPQPGSELAQSLRWIDLTSRHCRVDIGRPGKDLRPINGLIKTNQSATEQEPGVFPEVLEAAGWQQFDRVKKTPQIHITYTGGSSGLEEGRGKVRHITGSEEFLRVSLEVGGLLLVSFSASVLGIDRHNLRNEVNAGKWSRFFYLGAVYVSGREVRSRWERRQKGGAQ